MLTGEVSATKAVAILRERHSDWRFDRRSLTAACHAGRVPGAEVEGRYSFDVDELEAAIAKLTCCYRGCRGVALGPSGGCSDHGHVFLGARARGVKRPDIGAAISKAKSGSHHTVEARAKMAVSRRKHEHEPERRFCDWCGEQIVPRRVGLEDVPLERLAELGLDLVPGWVIAAGGGRFCSVSHATLWKWANEKFGPAEGPSEFKCAICRRPVERWPSQVANAEASAWRFVCDSCISWYRRFRLAAWRAVDDARPKAGVHAAENEDAFERLWTVAQEFEAAVVKSWPRTGRRPPLAVDLVILTLYRRGFTDKLICDVLNHSLKNGKAIPGVKGVLFDVAYVKQRRKRTGVRRPPAR